VFFLNVSINTSSLLEEPMTDGAVYFVGAAPRVIAQNLVLYQKPGK
jgi:hypothetical protein